jgi:alpha/beta superfamily hydrolase
MLEHAFLETKSGLQLLSVANHGNPNERSPKLGLLICHAFGEERQKTYRSTYHFTNSLADRGIPSLRFDYVGTGDSEGDLPDVSVESMYSDTILAANYAKETFGVEQLVILGIRFGAALAARATSALPYADACVMWNPIANGKDFLTELLRTEKIIRITGKKGAKLPVTPPADTDSTVVEADLMTVALAEQMSAIDLASNVVDFSNLLITGLHDDKKESEGILAIENAQRSTIPNIEVWLEQPREYWTGRAMYDAYFPTPTFEKTLQWLDNLAG